MKKKKSQLLNQFLSQPVLPQVPPTLGPPLLNKHLPPPWPSKAPKSPPVPTNLGPSPFTADRGSVSVVPLRQPGLLEPWSWSFEFRQDWYNQLTIKMVFTIRMSRPQKKPLARELQQLCFAT